MTFSNSLIIHEEKTKEITTVKEVWICDPNYHKIRRSFALIFSKNYQCFEKLYQTLERVFHQISKHFEVGWKNSAAPCFFQPTSQCLDIWWNTLPRVWYITSKVITWLRLLRLVIGLKDWRQFFNQWQAKPNPIAPCTRDFSRASSELQVIARNCDWFMALFFPLWLIGVIALVLVFRQSFENRSKMKANPNPKLLL